jgi:hypothetical protein
MATMDVFKNNAFSMTALTGTVEKIDYVPQMLGQLNIFEPMPVRTRDLWIDRREGALALIGVSALGAPPDELVKDSRDAVALRAVRLAKGQTIYAHEVEGYRAFGSETEFDQVQAEYLRRMARVQLDLDLTHEFHRLGALQGLLLDADGVSIIYDYFAEFGFTRPAVIDFDLDNAATNVRQKCVDLKRDMVRNSRGAIMQTTSIHALCGDQFYDDLVDHPTIRATYLNWAAATDLRTNTAFESFVFGGVTWHNYRGTDNNSTVAIPTNEAKFFPVGARDVFKKAMAPAEFGPFVNTPGRDMYAINILDRDRMAWSRGEIYSYPLYLCQQPQVLRTARSR